MQRKPRCDTKQRRLIAESKIRVPLEPLLLSLPFVI
jgi:hypothetical protein